MATRIQLRRDISANWINNNPILAEGEIGIETDTNKLKIGNGISTWNILNYYGSALDKHSELTLDDGTNPHGTTKSDIGLSNVNNTSDIGKPISTATQTALDLKLDKDTSSGVERTYIINADGSQGVKPTSEFNDVLEFANLAAFPATGEIGKIYVDLSTNSTYRWSGSTYVQVGGGKKVFILQTDIAFAATTASVNWWTYPREGLRIGAAVFYLGSYNPILETYGENRCLRWTLPFNCRLIDANFKYSTLTNPMTLNVFSFKQNDNGNIYSGKTIASKIFPSDSANMRILSYSGSEIDTSYQINKGDNVTLCANFNGLAAGGLRVNCLTLVFEEI